MTAHECLIHPWLTGDSSLRTRQIPTSRYINFRDRIRAKYANWKKYVLPIGRLAEYSSLRKLLVEKYHIQDTTFGKIEKIPMSSQKNCTSELKNALFFRPSTSRPKIRYQAHQCLRLRRTKCQIYVPCYRDSTSCAHVVQK